MSAAGIAPFDAERAESAALIRDSARALLGSDRSGVRALRFTEPGFDAARLAAMAQAGWIGLALPEAAGGSGLGMAEAVALAEELGRALAPEPVVALIFSAALLAAAGEARVLPRLLSGGAVVLTAWQDRANTLEVAASPGGARCFVPMGAGATHLLWPVREGGRLALHLLARDMVEVTTEATQDGGHWARVRPEPLLDQGPGSRIAGDVTDGFADALDRAALLTAAELLGGMEAGFALTLDYLRTRRQFGRAIGSFQALQHRAADAKLQLALTRAAVEQAAAALDAGAAGDAARAIVSRAKARAGAAAMAVQQAALQLHGGIGYTDQYEVGLHLRRAMVRVPAYGGAALHRARFHALTPEMEDA